ncbi:hypothetical protein SprV_0401567100 [Sparganum proliferum]
MYSRTSPKAQDNKQNAPVLETSSSSLIMLRSVSAPSFQKQPRLSPFPSSGCQNDTNHSENPECSFTFSRLNGKQPGKRMALAVRDAALYKADIVALSETRFAE